MKNFHLIIKFFMQEKKLFFTTVSIITIVSLFSLIIPILVKILLDYVIVAKISHLLNLFCLIATTIICSKMLFTILQDYLFLIFRHKIEKKIVIKYIHEILNLKLETFQKCQSGDLIDRATNLIKSFQHVVSNLIYYFFYAILISIIIIFLMFFVHKWLFLGTLIFLLFHILNFFYFSINLNKKAKKYYQQRSVVSSFASQFFDGYIQIITSWQQHNYIRRFREKIKHQAFIVFDYSFSEHLQICIQDILVNGNYLFIIFLGGYMVMNNSLSIGSLLLFILLLQFLFEPIYRLGSINMSLQQMITQLERIYEYIEEPDKESIKRKENDRELISIESIQFKDLCFQFDNDKVIYQNSNIKLEKGTIYHLSGKSGIGKTTLFYLLIRMIEPTHGKILFNNIDYTQFSIEDIRNRIVFGLQDSLIYSGSILNNITTFTENNDMQKIEKAANQSNAKEHINKLKHQYHHMIEEGGKNLSGGQKQRISLARLFYDSQDKDIILLDEPTSNLDEKNEEYLFNSLNNIKHDKLIIVISHREKIKKYCDKIITIEKQNLIESN